MALQDFFPARPTATPTIYAFASTHPDHEGLLKVGDTERVTADWIAWMLSIDMCPAIMKRCEREVLRNNWDKESADV